MDELPNSLINLKDLLHPRITEYCIPLFNDGHFKQSANEAPEGAFLVNEWEKLNNN